MEKRGRKKGEKLGVLSLAVVRERRPRVFNPCVKKREGGEGNPPFISSEGRRGFALFLNSKRRRRGGMMFLPGSEKRMV